MSCLALPVAALLISVASAAQAHTGVGNTAGFAHGFAHPLGGIDHILVIVAVGLFAARLGGRALWRHRGGLVADVTLALTVAVTAGWTVVLLRRTPEFLPWLRWVEAGRPKKLT